MIDQINDENRAGDCQLACIANALQVEYERVYFPINYHNIPDTEAYKDFHSKLETKLISLGYTSFTLKMDFFRQEIKKESEYLILTFPHDCYCILCGLFGKVRHCMVGYIDSDLNISIVHDPSKISRNIRGNSYSHDDYTLYLKTCDEIIFMVNRMKPEKVS